MCLFGGAVVATLWDCGTAGSELIVWMRFGRLGLRSMWMLSVECVVVAWRQWFSRLTFLKQHPESGPSSMTFSPSLAPVSSLYGIQLRQRSDYLDPFAQAFKQNVSTATDSPLSDDRCCRSRHRNRSLVWSRTEDTPGVQAGKSLLPMVLERWHFQAF